MDNNTQQNNIKQDVLEKIKTGQIQMKSRARFISGVTVLVCVTILVFIISALLISYIFFSIYTSGHLFLLGFGTRGFYQFILYFPWLLLALDALLLLLLDFLLKRFKFVYHRPVLIIFLGTLFLIAFIGFLVDLTSLHRAMMYRAEERNLPVFGGFYDGLRKSHRERGIVHGEVISINGSELVLRRDDYDDYGFATASSTLRVVAPISLKVGTFLQVGDEVFVAGDIINGEIHAYGIRKINTN
ncbi:MAG TPA: hypothetical protein VJC13_03355 [Candidatus Paceibacterota bacterium]